MNDLIPIGIVDDGNEHHVGHIGRLKEHVLICIELLKYELFRCSMARYRMNPFERIMKLGNATPKMLGNNADRNRNTQKSAGLAMIGNMADEWLEAAHCLIQIVRVMDDCGIAMPPTRIEMMLDAWKCFSASPDARRSLRRRNATRLCT